MSHGEGYDQFGQFRAVSDLFADKLCTVELQWLEHPWDYENLFETRVVQVIEGWL